LAVPELLPVGADRSVGANVAQAQDDIRAADVLNILYPLWWLSIPATMTG
jgi:NAD(P)H dehydrogenase (quinone)